MAHGFVRYLLFLIAYIPIYIIAALKTINASFVDENGKGLCYYQILKNNILPISLVTVAILLIIYFKVYSSLALRPKGNPIFKVKEINLQHKEYVTYLGTYILPFVALKINTVFDMAAAAFMFLTIGFIFSKTNLIYTNPTLAFFGFDIYSITDEDGNLYDCITKENLIPGDQVKGIRLGDNVYIISKW